MDTVTIIKQIDAEISRLQQAKSILAGIAIKKSVGRPKGIKHSLAVQPQPAKGAMSAESRARIAKAQKARWAKIRKAAKKVATKTPTV